MNLLVAVDGSDESYRALEYAANIARAVDGSITLAHAVEPDVYDTGGDEPRSTAERRDRLIVDTVDAAEARGQEILAEAVETAETLGVDASAELLYGDPVVEITDYADREGYETIYVGHRGLSGRAAQVLGSVARDIVERTTVPVTVIR